MCCFIETSVGKQISLLVRLVRLVSLVILVRTPCGGACEKSTRAMQSTNLIAVIFKCAGGKMAQSQAWGGREATLHKLEIPIRGT